MQDKTDQLRTEFDPTIADGKNKLAEAQTALTKERQPGGVPNVESELWEARAAQILDDIRKYVSIDPNAVGIPALGQAVLRDRVSDDVAFRRFLQILDAFISQLIGWAEQTEPPRKKLRDRAGSALSRLLQHLLARQQRWHDTNKGFKEQEKQLGDKRGMQAERSAISRLAVDYVEKVKADCKLAPRLLSLTQKEMSAILLNADTTSLSAVFNAADAAAKKLFGSEEYYRSLIGLPDLGKDSEHRWCEVIRKKMREDQVWNLPELSHVRPPDSREGRGFWRTVDKAIKNLARKRKH